MFWLRHFVGVQLKPLLIGQVKRKNEYFDTNKRQQKNNTIKLKINDTKTQI